MPQQEGRYDRIELSSLDQATQERVRSAWQIIINAKLGKYQVHHFQPTEESRAIRVACSELIEILPESEFATDTVQLLRQIGMADAQIVAAGIRIDEEEIT